MNTLYYGDNLDVLRRYIGSDTVDLVYLDPPFKSDQNYNVLFVEQDGSRDLRTFKQAPKAKRKADSKQTELDL